MISINLLLASIFQRLINFRHVTGRLKPAVIQQFIHKNSPYLSALVINALQLSNTYVIPFAKAINRTYLHLNEAST